MKKEEKKIYQYALAYYQRDEIPRVHSRQTALGIEIYGDAKLLGILPNKNEAQNLIEKSINKARKKWLKCLD